MSRSQFCCQGKLSPARCLWLATWLEAAHAAVSRIFPIPSPLGSAVGSNTLQALRSCSYMKRCLPLLRPRANSTQQQLAFISLFFSLYTARMDTHLEVQADLIFRSAPWSLLSSTIDLVYSLEPTTLALLPSALLVIATPFFLRTYGNSTEVTAAGKLLASKLVRRLNSFICVYIVP